MPPQWGARAHAGAGAETTQRTRRAGFAFGAQFALSARAMSAPITIEGVEVGAQSRPAARPRGDGPRPGERLRPLYSRRAIRRRVRELADEIRRDYRGSDLVVVGVLKGAFVFAADLVRALSRPLTIDFVGLSSYRDAMDSSGAVTVTRPLSVPVAGRDVLVVEDLLDTGSTLAALLADLRKRGARSVRVCALLDKPERRVTSVRADYVGFTDVRGFVAGYGIDFAERYRERPDLVLFERRSRGRAS
jgi:hypoxanthine phosphoribosyltransferase